MGGADGRAARCGGEGDESRRGADQRWTRRWLAARASCTDSALRARPARGAELPRELLRAAMAVATRADVLFVRRRGCSSRGAGRSSPSSLLRAHLHPPRPSSPSSRSSRSAPSSFPCGVRRRVGCQSTCQLRLRAPRPAWRGASRNAPHHAHVRADLTRGPTRADRAGRACQWGRRCVGCGVTEDSGDHDSSAFAFCVHYRLKTKSCPSPSRFPLAPTGNQPSLLDCRVQT